MPAHEIVKSDLADPTSDGVIEVLILAHERGGPIVCRSWRTSSSATTTDLEVLDEIESEGLEMKICGCLCEPCDRKRRRKELRWRRRASSRVRQWLRL